jgi:hypothetical protein
MIVQPSRRLIHKIRRRWWVLLANRVGKKYMAIPGSVLRPTKSVKPSTSAVVSRLAAKLNAVSEAKSTNAIREERGKSAGARSLGVLSFRQEVSEKKLPTVVLK